MSGANRSMANAIRSLVSSWDAEFRLDQKTSAETVLVRQQCLYFFPLPQLQGSFLPSFVFSVADRWGMFPVPRARTLRCSMIFGRIPFYLSCYGLGGGGAQPKNQFSGFD